MEAFYAYHWPGNVRELQNVLQRYLATRHLDMDIPLLRSLQGRSPDQGDMLFSLQGLPLPEAVKPLKNNISPMLSLRISSISSIPLKC